jgi:hypothetical protein
MEEQESQTNQLTSALDFCNYFKWSTYTGGAIKILHFNWIYNILICPSSSEHSEHMSDDDGMCVRVWAFCFVAGEWFSERGSRLECDKSIFASMSISQCIWKQFLGERNASLLCLIKLSRTRSIRPSRKFEREIFFLRGHSLNCFACLMARWPFWWCPRAIVRKFLLQYIANNLIVGRFLSSWMWGAFWEFWVDEGL